LLLLLAPVLRRAGRANYAFGVRATLRNIFCKLCPKRATYF
jgi:hypothetical protein